MDDTHKTARVPKSLGELLHFSTECGCGRRHEVDLRSASIRRGAVDDVVPLCREVDPSAKILVVADFITRNVLGDQVEQKLKKAGFKVQQIILPDGAGGRPHADEKTLKMVESVMGGFGLAVAVGSGTVNDLTKLASFNRRKPYITVATAPSMNGYTSAIAAIMQGGVKRTIECHQPVAVVADLDILSRAPHHLIASGLGDLESKPTATADYRLGGALGRSYYCSAPENVVLQAEQNAANAAPGLKHSDPESIAALTEALILSGISMKLAGSSSPASGGEHLISHYWDMTADAEGRLEGWHGAQVGVATIVIAALYEHLRQLDPGQLDFEKLIKERPTEEALLSAARARHGDRGDAVAMELLAKRLDDDAFKKELTWIGDHYAQLWEGLGDVLRPAKRIAEILKSAGAATSVSQIGLTPDHLRRAFIAAREIRGRYTILDLAADLGQLDGLKETVLAESGCLL